MTGRLSRWFVPVSAGGGTWKPTRSGTRPASTRTAGFQGPRAEGRQRCSEIPPQPRQKAHSVRQVGAAAPLRGSVRIRSGSWSAVVGPVCGNLENSPPAFKRDLAGSCPNLMMNRSDHADARPVPMALTPQLPPRAHRPLCVSVSSDSSGRFKALETQEWKNNLKAQMEQAHSAGAASSTGSLERASLFCASASTTASGSGLSSPLEILNKSKSSSRFSLFSPPWNSSSESDSNPPSRSGSKKLRNYSRRAATGPAGARGLDVPEPKSGGPEHFQYSEPFISKVTDYIYVGNLNAAYNGRTLCRNNIDSIIDMSSVPGELGPSLNLIPCTCSRAPATAGLGSRWTLETCRTLWPTDWL
ncbi:hypothetical protein Q5P01_012999 [Channa striata]|uniref:Uncharacterized protein n=1 Tax=Channa striata TaxID=64152 RepID=A0AA88SRM5_CHASR|nr:hypothetical protein Q5P01_012999 [Channa striata]